MNNQLPDITTDYPSAISKQLDWVGMENIALSVKITSQQMHGLPINASVDVFVSLDKHQAKGIHMSRLYSLLNEMLARQPIEPMRLNSLLSALVDSQVGLSESAKLKIKFDLVLEKPALRSALTGFQSYPIEITSEYSRLQFQHNLKLTVPYSSTCPCSAALSRRALSEAIDNKFSHSAMDKKALLSWIESEQGTVATPHSQRSFAYVEIGLTSQWPEFDSVIELIETAIATPLQTAVKREDEQAFAKLNAENLMFCEDVARRIKTCLEHYDLVTKFQIKVEHQESLHAHNAVAYASNEG